MQRELLDRRIWETRAQTRVGDLRVDRGVLQPRPPPHLHRRSQPSGLRSTSHRRPTRGM